MFSLRLRSKEVEVKADTVFFPNRSQIRIGEKRTCVSSNKPHVETRPFSSVHHREGPTPGPKRSVHDGLQEAYHGKYIQTRSPVRAFLPSRQIQQYREKGSAPLFFLASRGSFIHQRKKDQLIGRARNEKSGDDPFSSSVQSTVDMGTQNPKSSRSSNPAGLRYILVRYIFCFFQILNSLQ